MRSSNVKSTILAAGRRLDRHATERIHTYSFSRSRYGLKMNVTVRASARRLEK